MTAPRPGSAVDDRERIEHEWLEQLLAGDERGLEMIFRTYVTSLCAFANSYLESRDEAEEIVQDLFFRLWEHRLTIEMPRGLRPYLYSAVRNRALNVLRSRRIEHSLHERLLRDEAVRVGTEDSPVPEGTLAAKDLAEALDRAVAEMPPRCREVFALLRYRHLSYAETAAVLAISPKTVEIHMSRALAFLRQRLAPWTGR
jgi:RNA polymerase sigma-70 factor (ECF subfamily)